MCDAAASNVFSGMISGILARVQVYDQLGRLTREEGAQGKARRCSVPGYVCRRLAREDGRQGRTVVQLYRITERERKQI